MCDAEKEKGRERKHQVIILLFCLFTISKLYICCCRSERAIKICLCFFPYLVATFSKVKNRTRQGEKKKRKKIRKKLLFITSRFCSTSPSKRRKTRHNMQIIKKKSSLPQMIVIYINGVTH